MNHLLEALKWRYATKRMNGKKVPQEKVDSILEAASLAPSSMGLQPYTLLVIENEETRRKLQPAAYNQPQLTEGSHLIVFASWTNVTEEQVDEYIRHISSVRNVPLESLDAFRGSLMGIVTGRSTEAKAEWAARQAYIAFGTAIAAAAVEHVDATPMEGFNPQAVDEILGLKEKGLTSVTMLALGYRDESADLLSGAKKVRRSKEKLILEVA
jgi:nitroreductase